MSTVRRGPLLTIVAVLAVGLIVLLVNIGQGGRETGAAADTAGAATETQAAATEPPRATTAAPEPVVSGGVYAGRTAGRELTIAIAVSGERAVGYACDGKKIEAWLEGTLTGDQLSLNAKDGTTAQGTVSAGEVAGTLTADGETYQFTADSAAPPSGLYEGRADVRGVAARIGWIVLPDGTQVGIASVGGDREPAPALDLSEPITPVTLDGALVTVTPITGGAR